MPADNLIDGRAIAQEVHADIESRVAALKSAGVEPELRFVRVGDDPASQVYVGMKERTAARLGIRSETTVLPEDTPEAELLTLLEKLNHDDSVHGVLVQAPLPGHIDETKVFSTVSPAKDVDGFHPVNAGKSPVMALPGCSYFDSAESFNMIRGGHVDVAIMGGLQVDEQGNLANWSMPGKPVLGVGGAMDLATGARRLIITMTHTDREGRSKVVPECTLPLTAKGAVNLVITDLAVFTVTPDGIVLTELMPGATLDDIRARTSASFAVADTVEVQS